MAGLPASTTAFLTRKEFPENFIFGVGSSSFQIEGAADEGGRKKSIWDTFCDTKAKVDPNETEEGDASWLSYIKGSDHYHQFERDTRLLKDLGVDSYRFSLSWSRILPNGRPGKNNEGVNKEGVAFYNNLINALKARGIEPFVTLFHWDLPQALQDEYGGFLNAKEIRKDFKNYADFCFDEFGDRVKYWATLNEPHMFAYRGYALGLHAPGQIDSRKPFTVVHHLLLSHAEAYNLYKEKYKASQGGEVGITLDSLWYRPKDPNSEFDVDTAERKLEFMIGWFMKPLTTGKYPLIMRSILNDRLPEFEPDDTKLLVNSFDYIGVNYYTAAEVFYKPQTNKEICDPSYTTFLRADGQVYGKECPSSNWIKIHEEGLENLLKWLSKHGDQIVFYVTENGVNRHNKSRKRLSYDDCKEDDMRKMYHHDHLKHILAANKNGVKVKGYFAWSFMDSFEWSGDDDHFGLYHVDYYNNFVRRPKDSAVWYKSFLKRPRTDESPKQVDPK